MNKKAVIVTAIAATIGAALGTFVVKSILGDDSIQPFDQVLVQAADQTNRTLPMMVNKDTRLDATMAGPGNVFTYFYTLVNFSKADVDTSVMKGDLHARLVANYRSHPKMKRFRDQNVELHYQYKDRNGLYVCEDIVSPRDF